MSIDTNVTLWLDCRSFCNYSPLKKVDGFVIITSEIHKEFDAYMNAIKELKGLNFLPAIELLQLWHASNKIPLSTVSNYGKCYIPLNSSQLDEVVEWMLKMRKKFLSQGQEIFKEYLVNICENEVENKSSGNVPTTESGNDKVIYSV